MSEEGSRSGRSSAPPSLLSFLTISGSAYELDVPRRRIRRLANYAGLSPTARQAPDSLWQSYELLDLVEVVGETCVLVDWDGAGHATLTSALLDRDDVVRIQSALADAVDHDG